MEIREEDGVVTFCSPAGWIGLCAGLRGVTRISFSPTKADIVAKLEDAERGALLTARKAMNQIAEYFDGERRGFDLPLDFEGLTPFSVEILDALQKVPYGAVLTYKELAALAGHPRAARAVGRVMAMNRFPIVLPCQRVVGRGGGMTGYSGGGGVATKEWLLRFERSR